MTTTGGRTEKWLEAHLASNEVAHVLYGTVVGLAVVLALQHDKYRSAKVAGFLIGTAITISLAGLFSEAISTQARRRADLTRADRRVLRRETVAELFGCGFPAAFFVLAALGAIQERTAFLLAKWSGIALVVGYAYLASRLAGHARGRAVRYALLAALVGIVVVQLKALAH